MYTSLMSIVLKMLMTDEHSGSPTDHDTSPRMALDTSVIVASP